MIRGNEVIYIYSKEGRNERLFVLIIFECLIKHCF